MTSFNPTIPITRQIGGTCYAHSVTRCVFRLLRVLEVTKDPQVFDNILNWTIAKFGSDGGDCTKAMEELLHGDSSPATFPAELKQYLRLREYEVVHGTGNTTRNAVGKVMMIKCYSRDGSLPRELQEALEGNREPIFWFGLFDNQWDVLRRHNFDASIMDETHIPDNKVMPLHCHAVVLANSDDSGISFKNSWGDRWGNFGCFKLHSLAPLFKGRGYVHFLDVAFDESLPEIYRNRIARFNDHDQFQRLRQIPFEDLRLREKIGEGRFSKVHKGEFDGQSLAIKVATCPQDEFFRLRELKYLMDHKNIVKLKYFAYRCHETANHEKMYDLRIAMTLERHGSLTSFCSSRRTEANSRLNKRALMAGGVVGWTHFFNIALDLAEALHYLLTNGFVHGDVCSDNVLIGENYVAKLGDLGTVSSMHTLTPQELGGHRGWMSPELLAELGGSQGGVGRILTHKSDVFGFGRVLEYMLNPDRGNDTSDLRPCPQLQGRIPESICEIIVDCLEVDPASRPDAERLMKLIGLAYGAGECTPRPAVNSDRFEGLVVHSMEEEEADESRGETNDLELPPVISIIAEVPKYACQTLDELLDQLKSAANANDLDTFKAYLRINVFPSDQVSVLDVGGRLSTLLSQQNIFGSSLAELSLTKKAMTDLCRGIQSIISGPRSLNTKKRRNADETRVLQRRPATPTLVPAIVNGFGQSSHANRILLDQEPPLRPSASSSKEAMDAYVLHCIKHRLGLKFLRDGGSSATVVGDPRVDFLSWLSRDSRGDQEPLISALERILSSADAIVREYVLSALLERRCAVPLYMFVRANAPSSLLNDLLLTRTHVGHGDIRCLVSDLALPRIAIVETIARASGELETQILMKECYGVHSLGGGGCAHFIEAGFGFCEGVDGKLNRSLVLHVKGCYELFRKELAAMVDVVVVHTSGEWLASQPNPGVYAPIEGPLFIYWQTDQILLPEKFGKNILYAPSVHDEMLQRNMRAILNAVETPATPRLPFTRIENDASADAVSDSFQLNAVDELKTAMLLQASFRHQAELQRTMRSEYRLQKRQQLTECIVKEMDTRRELLRQREYLSRLRSLEEFITVLSTADPCRRIESFIRFSQQLAAKVDESLGPLKERRRGLAAHRIALQKQPMLVNEAAEVQGLIQAVEVEYSNKVVSTEHLWRETACIYEADSTTFSAYPDLAAAHLLDGFPLELVDGDSSQVNRKWFEDVLKSLESRIVKNTKGKKKGWKPTVTVLSILGCQSSGKSTLLNLMFGCRLRTSIERCTKGINMQLIPSTRPGHDFVLVLDVEGVRAPEFSHRADANLHDNRLGVFAVWCADVTLVLMNNTHSNDMEQILSLVKYLSDRASVTQQSDENGCSELIFAMRSVQINADPEARRRLKEDLCRQMELAGAASNLLKTFNSDEDVFILGNLFGGDKPPEDTPLSSYGEGCLELRERIHLKAIDHQRFISFASWKDRVLRVGEIVQRLENKMRVQSAKEIIRREQVEDFTATRRMEMSRAYQGKLESFDTEFPRFIEEALATLGSPESPDSALLVSVIVDVLVTELQVVEQEQSELLRQYFADHEELQEFEQDSLDKWATFLQKERSRCERVVRDLVHSRHAIRDQFNRAKIKITEAVHRLCKRVDVNERRKWGTARRNQEFESIFSQVLGEQPCDAPEKYIPDRVKDLYIGLNKIAMSDSVETADEEPPKSKRSKIQKAPKVSAKAPTTVTAVGFGWAEKMISSISSMMQFLKSSWSNCGIQESDIRSLTETLLESIQTDMLKEQIFSDSSVQKAIDLTESRLSNLSATHGVTLSFDFKETVHKDVMAWLIDLWVQKQTAWDNENSVRSKLLQSKRELKEYFEGMVLGRNELDLLVEAVRSHLNSHLSDAYKDQLKRTIQRKIRDTESGFVNSAKKLQAEVDLDLLSHFDSEAYLKDALRNPKEHYIRVQKNIILGEFGGCLNDTETWRTLLHDVKKALETAAHAASLVDEHKAREFFTSLHRNLNHAKLLDGLVSAADADRRYKNLDSQDSKQISSIANQIIRSLPNPSKPSYGNSSAEKEAIVARVFDSLRDCDIYPELKMRCNACCPRCGVQCAHRMGLGHDGLHETFHQPQGNIGVRWDETTLLCAESCVRSAAANHYMKVSDGNSVPYREFNTRYPEWSNPDYSVEPYSLKVRELIFRYKQPMLHEMYPDTLPCPEDQMKAFEHGGVERARREIREELNRWN